MRLWSEKETTKRFRRVSKWDSKWSRDKSECPICLVQFFGSRCVQELQLSSTYLIQLGSFWWLLIGPDHPLWSRLPRGLSEKVPRQE